VSISGRRLSPAVLTFVNTVRQYDWAEIQAGPSQLGGVTNGSPEHSMDMHHIRYFLAVCETLNFTRAAEKCNVTQPALSRAIQQLENEVGGLLFRRERSLTHITDLGALLRPRMQQ